MSRKALVLVFVAACFCIAGISIAADKGPAEMTLQAVKDAAKKPKPAVFPHAKHQEIAQCADCHHSAACRSDTSRMYSVSWGIRPLDSASLTNVSGDIAPRVGCRQRASASTPTTRSSRNEACGW